MSGILAALAGIKTAIATAVDEYFNRTTLLLNTSSTNGAQNNTFLDSSTNNFTITRNGNTTQGTFTPFSQTGWSNYFSSSYIDAGTSLFNYTTGNASTTTFTIEAYVYLNSYQTATNAYHLPCIIGKGDVYLNLGINGSGNLIFYHYDGSVRTITGTAVIPKNTWTYVAVRVTGGTATIYVGGTSDGSGTWYGIATAGQNTSSLIGRASTNASALYFDGYIASLRVSTTARTISVPTSAYSSDANTALLTCQANRFIDQSSNAYTLTLTGSPSVQAFSPFAPTAAYDTAVVGGSGYFDGSGDSVVAASNAAFALGTGDFSIECWIYFIGTAAGGGVSGEFFGSTTTGAAVLRYKTGTLAMCKADTSDDISASVTLTVNQWYHICATRTGTTGSLYVNGTRVATNTSYTVSYGQGDMQVISGTNGYLSSCRLIKGSNPYGTGTTLTLPTAPVTAITNTSLLLNYTNSGIYDSTAKNVLETVGNAQVSTAQAKWGTTSMYFDGTGDSLKGKLNNAIGGGDYTIEGWLYTGASGARYIFDMRETSQYLGAFTVGTTLYVNIGTTLDISATTSYPQNTWVHFAMVRSGSATNNTSVFLGGSRITQVTDTTNYSIIPTLYVGNDNTGAYSWSGYIDDFRITKGYARYSGSTYTVPAAAFPLQ